MIQSNPNFQPLGNSDIAKRLVSVANRMSKIYYENMKGEVNNGEFNFLQDRIKSFTSPNPSVFVTDHHPYIDVLQDSEGLINILRTSIMTKFHSQMMMVNTEKMVMDSLLNSTFSLDIIPKGIYVALKYIDGKFTSVETEDKLDVTKRFIRTVSSDSYPFTIAAKEELYIIGYVTKVKDSYHLSDGYTKKDIYPVIKYQFSRGEEEWLDFVMTGVITSVSGSKIVEDVERSLNIQPMFSFQTKLEGIVDIAQNKINSSLFHMAANWFPISMLKSDKVVPFSKFVITCDQLELYERFSLEASVSRIEIVGMGVRNNQKTILCQFTYDPAMTLELFTMDSNMKINDNMELLLTPHGQIIKAINTD